MKVLLDRGASIDATDKTGQTALHKACSDTSASYAWRDSTRIMIVKVLLASGTSTIANYRIIDITDNSGDTVLHCVVRFHRKRDEILPLLLDNGANINRKNVHGETVVDIAR